MSAAISSAGFSSEMHLIVEQCVADLREAAGLEEVVHLPAKPAPSRKPPPLPTRRPPPLPKEVESSNALLGLAFAPTESWESQLLPIRAPAITRNAPLAKPAKPASPPVREHRRWPLFLCAFVAGVSAGAAVIASPVGHRPEVQNVVRAASHALVAIR